MQRIDLGSGVSRYEPVFRRRPPSSSRLRPLRQGRGVRGPGARAGDPPARGDARATPWPPTTSCCTAPAATAASAAQRAAHRVGPRTRPRRSSPRPRRSRCSGGARGRVGDRGAEPDRGEREQARERETPGRVRGQPGRRAGRRREQAEQQQRADGLCRLGRVDPEQHEEARADRSTGTPRAAADRRRSWRRATAVRSRAPRGATPRRPELRVWPERS